MSDSDCEDYCYYGTPLEDLDEDEIRKQKAPRVEDQYAKDKQGRRRFHGAFQGGFSAGYFNSVGTKEGWTPSTFVSSRGQRADSQAARPQDFMDDEDLASHGISPQGIQATVSYDGNDPQRRKRVLDPNGPIPGVPVLEEILKPTRETMGMKILQKLGWRQGQGVGPRVKRTEKLKAEKEQQRMYGCQLPPSASMDEDDSEDDCNSDTTFAPDDVQALYLTKPKGDTFGLGYKPLDRTPVLGGHINLFEPGPLNMREKKKKVLIKGQAFGVGAFEEEDEDIYATEDMSNYDFGEEERDKTKKGGSKVAPHMSLIGLTEEIEGFKLSDKPNHSHKIYPRPKLLNEFVPQHKPRRRRFERKENEIRGLGRHDMTSEQRARLISDTSKVSVEVRSGVKGERKLPEPEVKPSLDDTTEIDKIYEEFKNSSEKCSDFKPYAKDKEKQRRYELYLKMKERGQKDRYYLAQPRSMTEWQKEREKREFERAAQLFQPLTSSMASRFVQTAVDDSELKLKDGLNVDVPKVSSSKGEAEVDVLGIDIADERIKAAKMKMYGKLTQHILDWHPDRLLCRRFNIPNPYPESSFVGVRKGNREKFSLFNALNAPIEDTAGLQCEAEPTQPDSQSYQSSEDSYSDEKPDKPETFGLKVAVDGPPTMDLFKAIFQDSDSESDDEKDDEMAKSSSSSGSKDNIQSPKVSLNSEDKRLEKASQGANLMPNSRNEVTDSQVKDGSNLKQKQRVRVSRFEPRPGSGLGDATPKPDLGGGVGQLMLNPDSGEGDLIPKPESDGGGGGDLMPKPVFIPKKKKPETVEPQPGKGIFADIDFEELNSYRNPEVNLSNTIKIQEENKELENIVKMDTDSSEDEYGPPVPPHLKNLNQNIKKIPTTSVFSPHNAKTSETVKLFSPHKTKTSEIDKSWVDKASSKKSKKKDKHKHKKEKKKKKKQKDKKEKKKKHRRRSRSDSNSSDSSESD